MRSTPEPYPIVSFFEGRLSVPTEGLYTGVFINDILDADDRFWEGCHNFIQWVFPTAQPSLYNLEAPLLNTLEAKHLDKRMLMKVFERYMKFLGLGFDARGQLMVERPERIREWYQEGNHNLLRVTRVITCMRLCGCYREARNMDGILHLIDVQARSIWGFPLSKTTWDFWNQALEVQAL